MTEKSQCKISVLIPSLNVAGSIHLTLDSIINQTLNDIEIICVDAGSTDGTREVICEYAGRQNNLHLVDSDKKSYGYQVNLGLKNARGKYVAIVEDDFVDSHMYEYLYFRAEEHNADFVKSNFYFSKTLYGVTYPLSIKKFPIDRDTVVYREELKDWYLDDYSIWNGIYSREFLAENNIWLNETSGASYQDIGFVIQVISCAKKAVYMCKPLYYYRVNNLVSSSRSMDCLRFLYQEFSRILDGNILPLERLIENQKGIFLRLCSAFVMEADKILPAVNYDINSEHVHFFISWIQEKLNEAFAKNIITPKDFDASKFFDMSFSVKLHFLLHYPESYLKWLRNENDIKNTCVKLKPKLEEMHKESVILIGWGRIARDLYYKLYDEDIPVAAIIEQNSMLWGKSEMATPIIPLYAIKDFCKAAVVVLTVKKQEDRLQYIKELVQYGISEEDIIPAERLQ